MSEPSWSPVPGTRRVVDENWLFRSRRERYRSRVSGKEHEFFVLDLADSVNVIALTPEGELVMARQFRAGSNEDALEVPGGLLEPGEDPLEAGARELLEETGYSGGTARLVLQVYANPSLLTSRSVTIFIPDARRTAETNLDPNEEVTVELVPRDRIPGMIRDGRINHALVVTALLAWEAGW